MWRYSICFDQKAFFQPRHPVRHLGVVFFVPAEIESCVHSFVGCRIKIYSLILSAYVWDGAEDLFTNGFIKTCFSWTIKWAIRNSISRVTAAIIHTTHYKVSIRIFQMGVLLLVRVVGLFMTWSHLLKASRQNIVHLYYAKNMLIKSEQLSDSNTNAFQGKLQNTSRRETLGQQRKKMIFCEYFYLASG